MPGWMMVAALFAATPVDAPAASPAQEAPHLSLAEIKRRADTGERRAMLAFAASKLVVTEGNPADPGEAVRLMRQLADKGDVPAMALLGSLLVDGRPGIQRDVAQGIKLLTTVANGNEPKLSGTAALGLGGIYLRGDAVPKDAAQAVTWFRRGAELGNADAMVRLGAALLSGTGVKTDPVEALKWIERGAAVDQPVALATLAALYDQGKLVTADPAKARELYARAAERGYGLAASILAGHFIAGTNGTPKDDGKAFYYATLAAKAHDSGGTALLGMLYRMGRGTPVDLTEALKWDRDAAARGESRAMLEIVMVGQSIARAGWRR
jgi:uncharacterized protein